MVLLLILLDVLLNNSFDETVLYFTFISFLLLLVFFIRKLRSSCERPVSSLLDLCPMLLLLELSTNLHEVP